jgi:L-ascorbate metabolism protein UlaG (beta-lactamase superfamily)
MDIRFLGHSAFTLTDGGTTILIDPFLDHNPKAAVKAADVDPDVILLTHGHEDHFGDTIAIAQRTGATVVALTELAKEIAGDLGDDHDVRDPNLGGTVQFDWGWAKWVPAWHTSTTPKGTVNTPAGIILNFGGKIVYHLGDTCLFSDLALAARRGDDINVALVPIGGHYTMDRIDAVAAVELIGPKQVIPCHYDTFPPIETDVDAFKTDVEGSTEAQVVVLAPGDTHSA